MNHFCDTYSHALAYPEQVPPDACPSDESATIYSYGSPQGQVLRDFEPQDIRRTYLQIAAASAGMRAGPNQHMAQAWKDLVAPGESRQMAEDLRREWSCGTITRAWLRLLGVVHRRLEPPYRIARAFADVQSLVPNVSFHPVPPTPGMIVVFGRGVAAHMATLCRMDANGWVTSLDGGQETRDGFQCVLYRQRRATLVAAHGPHRGAIQALDEEPVLWWVDPASLAPLLALQWRLPIRPDRAISAPPL